MQAATSHVNAQGDLPATLQVQGDLGRLHRESGVVDKAQARGQALRRRTRHAGVAEFIEAGATVVNSVIRGPAVIGPGAKVIDAYIGPFTSIGKDVEINKSEIEHSIVLEGSLIHDLETRVSDSLIGRGVKIHRLPLKPVAHRFMLGDNSEVWIKW